MTVPGEVTLDEMKLLLKRAHKGEIIPLYVFVDTSCEYWPRQLTRSSSLGHEKVFYSSRKSDACNASCEFPHPEVKIFANYWFAYAHTFKTQGKPPFAIAYY